MERRDDEHLPEDLREAAKAMRDARTEPTPLQLDEIKLRAMSQADRDDNVGLFGSLAGAWRRKAIALLLAVGVMFTSASGVVVASSSLGSKGKGKYDFKKKWTKPKKDSSHSQYCPPSKHDGSDSDTKNDSDPQSDCDNSDSQDSDSQKDTDSEKDSDSKGDSDSKPDRDDSDRDCDDSDSKSDGNKDGDSDSSDRSDKPNEGSDSHSDGNKDGDSDSSDDRKWGNKGY
jgi:hypothetical protein